MEKKCKIIYLNNFIYILSDDKIEDGDWCYDEYNKIIFQNKSIGTPGMSKKIIATTNTSLNLPQPSQQFINKFIEEYNKGNMINDVLVEYDNLEYNGIKTYSNGILQFDNTTKNSNYNKPKTDKNNTITIKRLKENWNREELPEKIIELCKKFQRIKNYNALDFDTNQTEFKQWISNNL